MNLIPLEPPGVSAAVFPLVFLVLMTTVAGVMGLQQQIEKQNWIVVTFGALFLLLEALVFFEAWRRWRKTRAAPEGVA